MSGNESGSAVPAASLGPAKTRSNRSRTISEAVQTILRPHSGEHSRVKDDKKSDKIDEDRRSRGNEEEPRGFGDFLEQDPEHEHSSPNKRGAVRVRGARAASNASKKETAPRRVSPFRKASNDATPKCVCCLICCSTLLMFCCLQ